MSETTGYVYYLQVGRLIKLGYSSNPRERLRQYPPESVLLAIEPGTLAIEKERLRQFSASLLWGNEWFDSTPDLEAHIGQMKKRHGLTNYMQPTYGVGGATGGKSVDTSAKTTNWMTVAGAAAELDVSQKTIRRWITSGLLEAERMGPRLIRVKTASLSNIGRSLQYAADA